MTNNKKLFKHIEEMLSDLQNELDDEKLSMVDYLEKVSKILEKYEVSRGKKYEKEYLKWKCDNPNISEQIKEDYLKRITEIESEELIASEYQNKLLKEKGAVIEKTPRHIVFKGPSGCGKTTFARLLAQALKEAGVVKGGFHEANGRDITGRYVGETRYLTQCACSQGGVLFLDEAYALATGGESDYGAEAVSTLLTEMEKPENDLIVIFAGYSDAMDVFLNSNPGLRSRIGYIVDFRAYNPEELCAICLSFLESLHIEAKAKKMIEKHFMSIPESTIANSNFGLARYSRNVASKISSVSARRHWKCDDGLTNISANDVKNALAQLDKFEKPKTIGFIE